VGTPEFVVLNVPDLARLRLRTESIASSKVEGMQMGARDLARAEARLETGGKAAPTAQEVIANIDAMELAVHQASTVERFGVAEIRAIHARLMEKAPNATWRDKSERGRAGLAATTTILVAPISYRPLPST
jgi:hypothetical protein